MRPRVLICVFLLFSVLANGQVDAIKRKSSENSGRKSEGGRSGSSGSGNVAIFFDVFRLIGAAQSDKLQKADSIKRLISLETFFQGAVQPSSYYLFNPRIRGNWGLFSTDFRMNYLIEDDHGNGTHDLTTFDWQILQLNLITTRNFTARVGGGNLYERFGDKQSFFEWTTGLSFYSNSQTIVANMEYRVAKDYITNAVPRREINFSLEKQIFRTGSLRGYATVGGVYQRYYQSVSVWGLQAGFVMRIF
ncbi:MAG: hypothetical protein HYR67_13580 [Bacteroidetes bacterium]|nr:hypothetical protein [Bacteroidota bacterium]